ncbi:MULTISPECIES: hypothetical protein [Pseudomonadales]|uniref:DnrO protein n=2 Tax=Pseudomonadales TaxID=72274 RepID=A0A1I4UD54_9GAMM|nr:MULTISPECIES: hypothetical protein [Pseudomonadales]AMQ89766.1 hypothetical protein ASQ50_14245 [Marinobacter sp. LQ44]SFM86909.1 hypothetical protein SAMN05216217_12032 [Halopseudomonas yangmingensis]
MPIRLSPIALPFALAAGLLFSGLSLASDGAAIHQHDHGDAPFELHLNNGEQWAIDAPLSKAMGEIGQAMRESLQVIHEDRLAAEDYVPLAKRVNDGVAYMVANCQLPPAADAQLHMIIAQLMAGAEKMAGSSADSPRDGAVQVIGALDAYDKYFDDPSFVPVAH